MCQRGHVLWAVDGDPPGPPLIRIARPAPANRVFDWGVMAGYELTFTLDIELAYPDPSLAQAPR